MHERPHRQLHGRRRVGRTTQRAAQQGRPVRLSMRVLGQDGRCRLVPERVGHPSHDVVERAAGQRGGVEVALQHLRRLAGLEPRTRRVAAGRCGRQDGGRRERPGPPGGDRRVDASAQRIPDEGRRSRQQPGRIAYEDGPIATRTPDQRQQHVVGIGTHLQQRTRRGERRLRQDVARLLRVRRADDAGHPVDRHPQGGASGMPRSAELPARGPIRRPPRARPAQPRPAASPSVPEPSAPEHAVGIASRRESGPVAHRPGRGGRPHEQNRQGEGNRLDDHQHHQDRDTAGDPARGGRIKAARRVAAGQRADLAEGARDAARPHPAAAEQEGRDANRDQSAQPQEKRRGAQPDDREISRPHRRPSRASRPSRRGRPAPAGHQLARATTAASRRSALARQRASVNGLLLYGKRTLSTPKPVT